MSFFLTKFGFNRSLLKIKQYSYGEKYLFFSHLKKNEMAQGRGWPKAYRSSLSYKFHPIHHPVAEILVFKNIMSP